MKFYNFTQSRILIVANRFCNIYTSNCAMPRKSKKAKFKPYKVRVNQYGEIFTNSGAVIDGTAPVVALSYLYEIFEDRIDKEVIKLVLDECDFNVDQASETLMSLCNDDSIEQSINHEKLKDLPTCNFGAPNYRIPLYAGCSPGQAGAFTPVQSETESPANMFDASTNENNEIFQHYTQQSLDFYRSWKCEGALYDVPLQPTLPNEYFVPDASTAVLNNTYQIEANTASSSVNPWESFQTSVPRFIVPSLPMHGSPSFQKSPGLDANRGFFNLTDAKHFSSAASKDSRNNKENPIIKEVIEKIQCGNHILIILRGLPGSGKTTFALKIKFSGVIYATDDFFLKNGKYVYDPNYLSEAHEWNKMRTKKALKEGLTPIIIDNTNTEAWEMKPYVLLGKKYNYEIVILEPDTPWKFNVKLLALRNNHHVHKYKIAKMKERYQHDITVEKILASLDMPTWKSEKTSNDIEVEKPNNDDYCVLEDNHISLRAIVHTADNSSIEDSSLLSNRDSLLFLDTRNVNNNVNCEGIQNRSSDNKNSVACEVNPTCNLDQLRALAKNETEDSESCGSTNGSLQEVAGWEDITEPDTDFQWRTSSNQLKSSALNEIALEEKDQDFQCDTSSSGLEMIEKLFPKSERTDSLYINESTDSSCIEDNTSSYSSTENIVEDTSLSDRSESVCDLLQTNLDLVIKETTKPDLSVLNSESTNISNEMFNYNSKYSDNPKNICESPHTSLDLTKETTKLDISVPIPESTDMSDVMCNYNSKSSDIYVDDSDLHARDACKNEYMSEPLFSANNTDQNVWGQYEVDATEVTSQLNDTNVNEDVKLKFSTEKMPSASKEAQDFISIPKPQRNNITCLPLLSKDPFSSQLADERAESTENVFTNCDWSTEEDEYTEKITSKTSYSAEDISVPKPQRQMSTNLTFEGGHDKFSKIVGRYRKPILNISSDSFGSSWSFPELTIDSPPWRENVRKNSLSFKMAASSQTEPRDFDFLYKIPLGNGTNTCGYTIIAANARNEVPDKTDLKLTDDADVYIYSDVTTFDKSTNTDDLVDNIEISQKLAHLQSCFPDISNEDLLHLLEICYNDERWISNLLLDWGYKYNVPAENSNDNNLDDDTNATERKKYNVDSDVYVDGIEFSTWKTNALSKSSTDVSSDTDKSASSRSLSEEPKETQSAEESNSVEEMEKLHLILDPAFSHKLQELFGPVLYSGNPKVEIDYELAKQIHDKWKNAAEPDTIFKQGEKSNSNHLKDKSKKIKKEQVRRNSDTMLTASSSNEYKECSSFSEIMDMEFACQLHKEEKLNKDGNFRTKMKRSELYSMFPGADTIVLDEIFESNNHSLEDSLHILGADITQQETVEKRENVKKFDARIKEWEQANMFQEFETGDWSSWVYQDDNVCLSQDTIAPVQPTTVSSEAAALRETAAHHYQLRQEYIAKAQAAYCRGMKDVASFYAQQGSEEGRIAKDTNKLAAALIAQERNASSPFLKIDLHGLHVQEAISVLEKFLHDKKLEIRRRQFPSPVVVTVITGQGLHSAQGAKLRPAVLNYLKNSKYSFSEVKTGLVEVTLMSE